MSHEQRTVREAVGAGVELTEPTTAGNYYMVERDTDQNPKAWLRSDTVAELEEWR
jgi:hypothetical protein